LAIPLPTYDLPSSECARRGALFGERADEAGHEQQRRGRHCYVATTHHPFLRKGGCVDQAAHRRDQHARRQHALLAQHPHLRGGTLMHCKDPIETPNEF
jgi:hypothetical protein